MERARKTVTLLDGRELLVEESTWESSAKRSAITERAKTEKANLNGSGDPVFFYFLEAFYSFLASCTSGELPEPEDALSLPDEDLDEWYRALVEVNPDLFVSVDFDREGEVTFRDGSSFRIRSSFLPSVIMRRTRLEEEALRREETRDAPKDIFGVYLYPVLASCSIGDIPPAEEIRSTWPEAEIYKWRDAVKEVNPHWFMTPEETQETTLSQSQENQKKNGPRG